MMRDPDLDSAVSASLNRKARTVRAAPVSMAQIEHRAGHLRLRRRVAAGALTLTVVAALSAGGVYLTQRPGTSSVEVTNPAVGSPPRVDLRGLVDTTKGHTCPSISRSQPTPQTTIIHGMQPTPNGDRILVPTALHAGYCATMPYLTLPYQVTYPFTVLADCSQCATPSQVVAISTSSARDTWTEGSTRGEQTGTLDGHPYGYRPPNSPDGRAMLAWPKNVAFGRAPKDSFLLIGHGLTKAQYLQLAGRLARSASPALPGLQTVYAARADEFDHLSTRVDRSVTMQWVTENRRAMVTYSYQHTAHPVSLAAYAWAFSDPRTVKTSRGTVLYGLDPDGHRHVYDYLLATQSADIAIEYASAGTGTPPGYLLTMLEHLSSVSTGSSSWQTFANLASRHTTHPANTIGKYDSLGGTFSFANP